MERATQRELIRRILGHVTNRTTDTGEAEARYPVEDYYDHRRFESEIAGTPSSRLTPPRSSARATSSRRR